MKKRNKDKSLAERIRILERSIKQHGDSNGKKAEKLEELKSESN